MATPEKIDTPDFRLTAAIDSRLTDFNQEQAARAGEGTELPVAKKLTF